MLYKVAKFIKPTINGLIIPMRMFSRDSDQFGRNLTRKIMEIRSNKDIIKILNRYRGSFNAMNITALLKKVNRDTLKDPTIQSTLLQQVRHQFTKLSQSIDSQTTRAIANIIGYIGNLNYHEMDDLFQKLKYSELLKHAKSKEIVMILTGLLKLGISDQCLKVPIKKVVMGKVDHMYSIGEMISIWRNLIKFGKCDQQLNQYFGKLIALKKPSNNLKDYGYLMYCFTEAPKTQSHQFIQKILEEYPEFILHSNRINIFEICIMLDHLAQFRSLHPEYHFSESFNYLLAQHYLRNIRAKPELRSLANGYYSLIGYFKKPTLELYNETGSKFIAMLNSLEDTNDFESIVSLMIQLQTNCPNTDNEDEFLQFSLQQMLESVLNFLFKENQIGQKRIHNMQNKQFQKLCFGLSKFATDNPQHSLLNSIKPTIIETTLSRKLTDLQLVSLFPIFTTLSIKSPQLCQHFYHQLSKVSQELKDKYKIDERINKGCLFGREGSCFNCIR